MSKRGDNLSKEVLCDNADQVTKEQYQSGSYLMTLKR